MSTHEQHQHIVREVDEQLQHLNQSVSRMGGLAESQLSAVIDAFAKRDSAAAQRIINADSQLDELEQTVENAAIKFLALRQPMAQDLREVVTAFKASHDIERIGDYAVNIAKRVLAINQMEPVSSAASIPRMGRMVQSIVKDTMDAYAERDAEKAIDVWHRDEEVDGMYTSLFRELLTYMMEDPRAITSCTHLLFIAKNIERIGDHATNVAETVHYLVTGERLDDSRPKSDTSSYAVVHPRNDEGGNEDGMDQAGGQPSSEKDA